MADLKLIFLFSIALFILVLLSGCAEGFPSGKTSTNNKRNKKIKVKQIKAKLGATCRLRCKIPSKTSEVVWFKDDLPLNTTKSNGYQIKRRQKQKLEFLKIVKISKSHCGLFECRVKRRGKQGAWRIVLSGGKGVSCKRTKRDSRLTKKTPVCGKADKGRICVDPSFPDCKSFAGLPNDINTNVFIHNSKVVIQIGWKPPIIGYNDLWGYQVHLLGFAGHDGHQRCIQINSKDKETYYTFHRINYGAEYMLMLQSLPSKEMFEKKVYVKEKCEFKEFKFHRSCCFISNLNSTIDVNRGTISLFMGIQCANESIDIKRFRIHVAWTNLQKPMECSGQQTFRNAISENSRSNYSIMLSEECQQNNYSIKVMGIHNSSEETRMARVIVSYPQKIPEISAKTVRPNDDSTKIFVAISGIIFGLALVALFFIYKYCFTKVVYKLPDTSHLLAVPGDHSQSRSGQPLLDGGIKRVFLMSARCCQKCKWVVHCLGELLTSTGMVEVRADLWSEIEISNSVVRWYEEEIREATCVVVLASSKMARWKQRTMVANTNSDDLLDITAQLNLVSGEIIRHPNSPKFIPAYFKYNGEPKDIPDFLSSRLAHKLPNDLDRLIYHVLNIEAIQPYRTRPIIVLGGSDHPLESRKEDLLRAISEAEEEHLRLESENNNSSSVA